MPTLSLKPFPLVISLHVLVNSLSPFFLQAPFHEQELQLLFDVPSVQGCSAQRRTFEEKTNLLQAVREKLGSTQHV